ncbi:MAG: hypothetical protein ACKVQU_32005 [Burkholderiales bacterium]
MSSAIKMCAAIAVAMSFASALHAQPVVLKFASFESAQAPFTAKVFTTWAEDVTKASNGALKVEMFVGGTLGRNPLQQLKLVQDGIADLAWTVPGYTPGGKEKQTPFCAHRAGTVPRCAARGCSIAVRSPRAQWENSALMRKLDL